MKLHYCKIKSRSTDDTIFLYTTVYPQSAHDFFFQTFRYINFRYCKELLMLQDSQNNFIAPS